jgi:23S rRNA U2552 (ribose-2'-O)-methylase RlmE/FtsJ
MSTYSLPPVPERSDVSALIDSTCGAEAQDMNPTLVHYLARLKSSIDERQTDWDRCKKLTNPYEYVHTPVPGSKHAVCKLRPLSRSFYKLMEMYHMMGLGDVLVGARKVFYLAEGPGGFVEAMVSLRGEGDEHVAISLMDDHDASVPGWKKARHFLEENPSVVIERGADGTGDLFNPCTLEQIREVHGGSADFVTADGGFNFAADFNRQEEASTQLIACQMAYVFGVQKLGGCAVVKFFDTFTQASLDLVYLLLLAYDSVAWVKPCTSRFANSERYAVCKGFRLRDAGACSRALRATINSSDRSARVARFLNCEVPYIVRNRVEEYNAIFGQQQVESISHTLCMIDNPRHDRADAMRKGNVNKCVAWCQKHKVPFNRLAPVANAFIGARLSSSQ